MRCTHQSRGGRPPKAHDRHLDSRASGHRADPKKRKRADTTNLCGGDQVDNNNKRERKRRMVPSFEALIPNEILAMVLAFVRPADVPAVRCVARRWRDLAPPREPDVVVAALDASCMGFTVAPRSKVKQRYLDRLRLEAAGAFVYDDDADDIRDVFYDFYGLGNQSLTLWDLFEHLQETGCDVEVFVVKVDEWQGVVDDYSVTRLDNKWDLAEQLVDWARYILCSDSDDDSSDSDDDDTISGINHEDDGAKGGNDKRIFASINLETDDGLRRASALIEKASRVVLC